MEREYIVIVHKGVDLIALDVELSAHIGIDHIPGRSCCVANARPGSKRMTHWYLTDEEAENLRSDPRILEVEIPISQKPEVVLGVSAFQQKGSDYFKRDYGSNFNGANWGLRRCMEDTNIYGENSTVSGTYEYAIDGTGVDVVIQDTGLQVDHPEFEDEAGISRVQQIDWYTESGLPGTQDPDHYIDPIGHGTHVAGIATGKTFGWAKNAHVYSQKLSDLAGGGGIPTTDAFDLIRGWHNNKTNGRPTIVNMSWGTFWQLQNNILSGTYRGTPWVYDGIGVDDTFIWDNYGILPKFESSPGAGFYRFIPFRSATLDVEIEEMIDDGIHICIAAGNFVYVNDIAIGTDYDNSIMFDIGGVPSLVYCHRGMSPQSERAITIGNIDVPTATGQDKSNFSSNRGKGVDVWAPGTAIFSSNSELSGYTSNDYEFDSDFRVTSITGTSMAAPQVVGVGALHLQSKPNLTPEQLKQTIIDDSQPEIYHTGLNNDYTDYNSLLGSENRVLFSRYGKQPATATNITFTADVILNNT